MKYMLIIFILFLLPISREVEAKNKKKGITIVGPNHNLILTGYDDLRDPYTVKLTYNDEIHMSMPEHIETSKPLFFYFVDPKEPPMVFHQFFAFPGDSIVIKKNANSDWVITGDYPTEYYILDSFRRKGIDLIWGTERKYSITNQLLRRNQEIQFNRNSRIDLLDSCRSRVRTDYYNLLRTVIDVVYYDYITDPFQKCSPFEHYTVTKKDSNYATYLKNIESQLSSINSDYISALSAWLPNVLVSYANYITRDTVDQQNAFAILFDKAKIVFGGNMRDLMLTMLMRDKINNEKVSSEYMNEYKSLCQSREYISRVDKQRVDKEEVQTSSELLNTVLEEETGKKIKWSDIVNNNDKPLYIDFWASWCAGCKLALPHLRELKKSCDKIVIALISVDEDQERWRSSIDRWASRDIGKHYWLDPNSKLASILAKPSIPRYTMVNKAGNISSIDASPPSNNMLRSELTITCDNNGK